MTSKPAGRWRYVPAGELDGRPHVVVDGAPRRGTVCTLSHWPGTPTPRPLWADTSAEIVLQALGPGAAHLSGALDVATVDHYDADGAIALALLVVEGLADSHGRLLAAAAYAGDFDVVAGRSAALVAFALAALGRDPEPAAPGGRPTTGRPTTAHPSAPDPTTSDPTSAAVRRALDHMPALADRPEAFEELWGPEAAAYDAACALAAAGGLTIEEHGELDLAVVQVDESHPLFEKAGWEAAPVHPAAVHSATSCLRVATLVGRRYELRLRYESWVRLVSRRPRRRVDLGPLAVELTEAEGDGGRWLFDGAGAITPALHRVEGTESTLTPAQFVDRVGGALQRLDRGAGAWDPYAPPGAAVLGATG